MNFKKLWFAFLIVILVLVGPLVGPTLGVDAQEIAEGATKVAWSPNGQYLAVSGSLGGVFIYSRQHTAGPLRSFTQMSAVNDVAWSPDGTKLLTADADYSVRIWDARNYRLLMTLQVHTKPVNGVSWIPDGSKFASVGDDGKLVIWDSKTYKPLKIIQYSASLQLVAWSPDGNKIATSVRGVSVEIWDAQGNHISSIDTYSIYSLNWNPDSTSILADLPHDNNIVDGSISISMETCGNPASTAWSHNGKFIAISGYTTAGDLCLIDTATGMVIMDLATDPHSVELSSLYLDSLQFSLDDKQLAGVDNEGHVLIWDVKTMKAPSNWPAPKTDHALVPSTAIAKLQLTSVCSPDPSQYRVWKVVNANPYDVVFRWFVVNSPQTQAGEEVVPAAQSGKPGERIFQTNTEAGDNTLNIFSPPDKLQDTASNTTAQCPASTPVATAPSP
ncbi:MAG: WD40 repeat domain-containing protein [Aggregatilineales bacterium]